MAETTVERLRRILGEIDVWDDPVSDEETTTSSSQQDPAAEQPTAWGESGRQRYPLDNGSDTSNELTSKNLVDPRGGRPHGKGKVTTSLQELKGLAFDDPGVEIDEMAALGETFAPWELVKRYADMYVGKANKPIVQPYFATAKLLETVPWDFFYIWIPDEPSKGPLLLVPSRQLEYLLQRINLDRRLNLSIPGGSNSTKFHLRFGSLGTPRPRYLGRARDANALKKLKSMTPVQDPDEMKGVSGMAKLDFVDFLKSIEASATPKHKPKSQKSRQRRRIDTRKAWGRASKRVQRYLGLRQALDTDLRSLCGPKLNLLEPAPFEAEKSVVFVCVDVETYEKNHDIVTEVGIATLDTLEIAGIPPGQGAEHWFKLIKARHLRIKEHSYMVNHEYVQGHPDNFEFGHSDFVSLKEAREYIKKLVSYEIGTRKTGKSGVERRAVVLVGHDVSQDVEHLKKLKVDVRGMPNLLEVIDNQGLQQHLRRMENPQRLESVLTDFDIRHRYLHNAGNDAVYTLQSLLALALCKCQKEEESVGGTTDTEPSRGDSIGWSTGGEDSDGGAPELNFS